MSWSLVRVVENDVDELMTWFPDRESVNVWGGPTFRYPFTRETFLDDCRWREFHTCRLQDETGMFSAFGQIGERYGRSHFARLIANPDLRGRGVGRALMLHLMDEARRIHRNVEFGLFVYRDNEPALSCYRSVGFEVTEYPVDAPMPEKCLYMIRSA